MKRFLVPILVLVVTAASAFVIFKAQNLYGSVCCDIYLALFVALPMLRAIFSLPSGIRSYTYLFKRLFPIIVSLVVTTVVYRNIDHDWLVAVVVGALAFALADFVRNFRSYQAKLRLNMAGQALERNDIQQALAYTEAARLAYMKEGNSAERAVAEWQLGMIYVRSGDSGRASRSFSTALQLFRATGNQKQVEQVQQSLTQLRQQGTNIAIDVSLGDTFLDAVKVDWGFFLDSVVVVGGLGLLFRLWEVGGYQGPLSVIGALGAALVIWLYGNYGILYLAIRRSRRGLIAALAVIVYNIAFVLLALGAAKFVLDRNLVHVNDFPFPFESVLIRLAPLTIGWPIWAAPGIMVGGVVLILFSAIIASQRLRFALGSGGRQVYFEEAIRYLAASDWSEAIEELSRLKRRETDVVRRTQILFNLAFAYCMAKQLPEARNQILDLIEIDARHKEGLYLAGYIALQSKQLDEAEGAWRKLVGIDRAFRPDGAGPEARYYLCLTL